MAEERLTLVIDGASDGLQKALAEASRSLGGLDKAASSTDARVRSAQARLQAAMENTSRVVAKAQASMAAATQRAAEVQAAAADKIQKAQKSAEQVASAAAASVAASMARAADVQAAAADKIQKAQKRIEQVTARAQAAVAASAQQSAAAWEAAGDKTTAVQEKVAQVTVRAQQSVAAVTEKAATAQKKAADQVRIAQDRLAQASSKALRSAADAEKRVSKVRDAAADRAQAAQQRVAQASAEVAAAAKKSEAAQAAAAAKLEKAQAQAAQAAKQNQQAIAAAVQQAAQVQSAASERVRQARERLTEASQRAADLQTASAKRIADAEAAASNKIRAVKEQAARVENKVYAGLAADERRHAEVSKAAAEKIEAAQRDKAKVVKQSEAAVSAAAQKEADAHRTAADRIRISREQVEQVTVRAQRSVQESARRLADTETAAAAKVVAAQRNMEAAARKVQEASDRAATGLKKGIGRTDKLIVNPLGRARKALLDFRTVIYYAMGATVANQVVKFASDFETALANVDTLLDQGAVSIGRYREQLDTLARQSPKELIDLTQGLYQTISAGIPAVEGAGGAFDVLKSAQRAAVAGLATTEQSVGAFTTVLNAYAGSGLKAADVSDKLFQTVRKGRTTFPELTESIGRVATVASRAGVGLDELLASVVGLTKAGLSTDEAVTQLRRLILGLLKPAEKVRKQFESLGIDYGEAALKAKGLVGVLQEVTDVTKGSADAFAQLFPNVRAMVGAVVLGGPGLDSFRQSIDFLRNSTGATDNAYEKISKTFDTTYKIFKSRLQAVFIRVGDRVLPKLGKALTSLGDILEKNQKQIGDVFEMFVDFALAVGKFVSNNGRALITFFTTLVVGGLLAKMASLTGKIVTNLRDMGSAMSAAKGKGAGFFGQMTAGLKKLNLGLASFGVALAAGIVTAVVSAFDAAEQEAQERIERLDKRAKAIQQQRARRRAKELGFDDEEARQVALASLLSDPAQVVTTETTAGREVAAADIFNVQSFLTEKTVENARKAGEALGLSFADAVDAAATRLITQTNAVLDPAISKLQGQIAGFQLRLSNLRGLADAEIVPFGEDLQPTSVEEEKITRGEFKKRLGERIKELQVEKRALEGTKRTREEIVQTQAKSLKAARAKRLESESEFEAQKRRADEAARAAQADKDALKASQLRGRAEKVAADRLSDAAKASVKAAEEQVAAYDRRISRLDEAAAKELADLKARGAGEDEIRDASLRTGQARLKLLAEQQSAVRDVLKAEQERVRIEQEAAKQAALRRLREQQLATAAERREAVEQARLAREGVAQTQAELKGPDAQASEEFTEKLNKRLAVQREQLAAATKAAGEFSRALAIGADEEAKELKRTLDEVEASSALVRLKKSLLDLTAKRRKEEEGVLENAKVLDALLSARALERGEVLPALQVELPEAPIDEFLEQFQETDEAVQRTTSSVEELGAALREALGFEDAGVANVSQSLGAIGDGVIRVGDAVVSVRTLFDDAQLFDVSRLREAAVSAGGALKQTATEIVGLLGVAEGGVDSVLHTLADLGDAVNRVLLEAVPEGEAVPVPVKPKAEDEDSLQQQLEELFRGAEIPVDVAIGITPKAADTFGQKLAKRFGLALSAEEEILGLTLGEKFRQKVAKAFEEAGLTLIASAVEAGQMLASEMLGAVEGIASGQSIFGGLKNVFGSILGNAAKPVVDALNEISPGIGAAVGPLIDAMFALQDRLLSSVTGPLDTALNAPLDILLGSFGDAVDALVDTSNLESEFRRERTETRLEHEKRLADIRRETKGGNLAEEIAKENRRFFEESRAISRRQREASPLEVLKSRARQAGEVLDRVQKELPEAAETFLVTSSKEFPKFLDGIAATVDALFVRGRRKAAEVIRASEKAVQRFFGQLYGTLKRELPFVVKTLLVESLSNIGENILGIVGGLITLILKLVQGIFDALPEFVEKLIDGLIDGIIWAVKEILGSLIPLIKSVVSGVIGLLKTILDNLFSWLGDLVEELLAAVSDLVKDLPELIGWIIKSIIEAIPDLIASLVTNFIPQLGVFLWKLVKGVVVLIKDLLVALLWDLPQYLDSVIIGLLKGLWGLIVKGADYLWGLLKKGAEATGEFFTEDIPNWFDDREKDFDELLGTKEGSATSAGAKTVAATGDPVFGGIVALGKKFGIFHDGGRIGAGSRDKGMASAFAGLGAQSFERGGMVLPDLGFQLRRGLMRDEAPAILQVGEGVLNREAMAQVGGAGGLQRLNNGETPQQVFGGTGPIQATVNIQPSGNAVMDALAQMLLRSAAVSMTTPGGMLRTAAAKGTLPGTKNVRGRS